MADDRQLSLYVSSYFSKDSEMFMKTQLMVGGSPEIFWVHTHNKAFFPHQIFSIFMIFSSSSNIIAKIKGWKRNLPSESIQFLVISFFSRHYSSYLCIYLIQKLEYADPLGLVLVTWVFITKEMSCWNFQIYVSSNWIDSCFSLSQEQQL